jgi:hypothetical protein
MWRQPQTIAAAVIIVCFAALTIYLLGETGTDQARWARLSFLYSSLEAVLFTAVGWVFGREVNRRRAENAEANVTQAVQRADASERTMLAAVRDKAGSDAAAAAARERATALEQMSRSMAAGVITTRNVAAGMGTIAAGTSQRGAQPDVTHMLDLLAEQANSLFPDLASSTPAGGSQ